MFAPNQLPNELPAALLLLQLLLLLLQRRNCMVCSVQALYATHRCPGRPLRRCNQHQCFALPSSLPQTLCWAAQLPPSPVGSCARQQSVAKQCLQLWHMRIQPQHIVNYLPACTLQDTGGPTVPQVTWCPWFEDLHDSAWLRVRPSIKGWLGV
jgi:hypothetical protein